jgi:hypothetical protein
MNEENGVTFILDEKNERCGFVYRPPADCKQQCLPATLGVKFAQRRVSLDKWWLIGGTRWSRTFFRLKHPIVYSKRGLKGLWRRML